MKEDRTMKNKIMALVARVMMVVGIAMMSVGTVWGETVTLVSGSGTSGYAIPTGWTSSGTVEGGTYLKFDNGTMTSPEFAPHTGLSFTYSVATFGSGTDHPLTIRILNASTNAVISEQTTAKPTSSSYISTGSPLSLGDVSVAFKIQLYAPTGKGIRLRNYSITGTPASVSSLEESDLALTNAPVSLSFDLYNNSSAQTVSFTTSSTGAISVSESEYISTSISGNTNTITVTPIKVTPSAQTITINQAADATYAAGTATFTVSVTDNTPSYKVTYKANGGTGNDIERLYKEGTNVTVEANTFSYAGHNFTKWNTAADGQGTDYLPEATITSIHADVVLYAQWEEPTYDFTQISGFSSWNNSYSDHTVIYSDATITFKGASRQTGTITNQPVTKGGDVSLVLTDGSTIKKASFVCTQWTNKAQIITLHYSTNGGNSYTSTGVTSSNFTISKDNLPEGTNAVKITFSNTSNQVGIASASIEKIAPSPTISADNVNIAYDATSGSIDYSINNKPTPAGTLTADSDDDWLTLGEVSASSVSFTCTANSSYTSREATITLTYTYDTNKTVTKTVTVTQAAAPEPTITISPNSVEVEAEGGSDVISIAYTILAPNNATDFEIQFYDSGDNEIDAPDWITTVVEKNGENYRVSYQIGNNTGATRTAYFKVFATYGETVIYSNLVTVTQDHPDVNYAFLPFEFNGGKGSLPQGLSASGLGGDYSDNNTKLKFDSTGDWLLLKINEAIPSTYTLSFTIKGNSFSGGTFKVQISADDSDFTDLMVFSSSIADGTYKIDNISSNVRYIKWIYTTKDTGNVGLGNIKLKQPEETDTKTVTAGSNGGKYWATFYCSGAAYTLPEGAQAFTMNSSHKLYLLGDGSVIPANTAVIIIADSASLTLTKTDDVVVEISGTENILRGSSYGMDISRISGTPYVLGIKSNALKFYKYIGNTVPANKVYYIYNE